LVKWEEMAPKLSSTYKIGVFVFLLIVGFAVWVTFKEDDAKGSDSFIAKHLHLDLADSPPEKTVQLNPFPDRADLNCKMYNCFNVYR